MSLIALLLRAPAIGACTSDLECSLNGVCTSGVCVCDVPWTGDASAGGQCGTLKYAMGNQRAPQSAKNIYNNSDPRNTWNGPIMVEDGTFHMFNPIYNVGSLGGPTAILHGTATTITGPWNWSHATLQTLGGENPAGVTFVDPVTKKTVYSLWIKHTVLTAPSPNGPWTPVNDFVSPGNNVAPLYHDGAWYATSQPTSTVYTTPALAPGNRWVEFASITPVALPASLQYHVEDPFMWVDKRGNWHIVNHAYANSQYENCGESYVSNHFFSPDGKNWSNIPGLQPYTHTVEYLDGTSHTFTTLERPNLHFDASGQLTHINLAVDLIVGDEGCANRTKHAHGGHTPCDNCKWDDHAGTTVIPLDTTKR